MTDIYLPQPKLIDADLAARQSLWDELQLAVTNTSQEELQNWAAELPKLPAQVLVRRFINTGKSLASVGSKFNRWAINSVQAHQNGKFTEHVGSLPNDLLETSSEIIEIAKDLRERVKTNPAEEIPKLGFACLGLFLGSGGPDGDGGLADLDLLVDIGAHRSVFTHSVIAGTLVETIALSFVSLLHTVHKNFPEEHSPHWDDLVSVTDSTVKAFSTGVSLGLAYHLGIDATLDGGGTYKDMPFSMPIEGHQAFAFGNAVVEGADALKRSSGGTFAMTFSNFLSAAEVARRHTKFKIKRGKNNGVFEVSGPSELEHLARA